MCSCCAMNVCPNGKLPVNDPPRVLSAPVYLLHQMRFLSCELMDLINQPYPKGFLARLVVDIHEGFVTKRHPAGKVE